MHYFWKSELDKENKVLKLAFGADINIESEDVWRFEAGNKGFDLNADNPLNIADVTKAYILGMTNEQLTQVQTLCSTFDDKAIIVDENGKDVTGFDFMKIIQGKPIKKIIDFRSAEIKCKLFPGRKISAMQCSKLYTYNINRFIDKGRNIEDARCFSCNRRKKVFGIN